MGISSWQVLVEWQKLISCKLRIFFLNRRFVQPTAEPRSGSIYKLARQKFQIKELRFLMHEEALESRGNDSTHIRFPSFRDLIISFLTSDIKTAEKIGRSKLEEYSSVILALLEKTKHASYSVADAFQDILDLRNRKDLLINPNLISYFAEEPNRVHVMANYLDVRFMKNSYFGNRDDDRDELTAFILDFAPQSAFTGFGHYMVEKKSQFHNLFHRNPGNPTKFWEGVAIFNADMSKFALHMLSIPAAARRLPPHKVAHSS
ncbi:hypothetical protein QAD02_000797 [Eretmocerus hayati]|uniref:Uncharacterized protein n=1 Tax=Eretmocerus hayati TaxID=131215 RepID=A0ACC2NF32_9HYME|nr:hypothetical protein QAD02_000797 [Eretmocerus hayati]